MDNITSWFAITRSKQIIIIIIIMAEMTVV